MDIGTAEKRKFRRVDEKSVVQFQGDNFSIYSSLSNIGEGGMFVNTYYLLDEGEKVSITFDLPRIKRVIGAKGKVVRHNEVFEDFSSAEVGVGISFEDLSDDDRVAIRDYVRAQA